MASCFDNQFCSCDVYLLASLTNIAALWNHLNLTPIQSDCQSHYTQSPKDLTPMQWTDCAQVGPWLVISFSHFTVASCYHLTITFPENLSNSNKAPEMTAQLLWLLHKSLGSSGQQEIRAQRTSTWDWCGKMRNLARKSVCLTHSIFTSAKEDMFSLFVCPQKTLRNLDRFRPAWSLVHTLNKGATRAIWWWSRSGISVEFKAHNTPATPSSTTGNTLCLMFLTINCQWHTDHTNPNSHGSPSKVLCLLGYKYRDLIPSAKGWLYLQGQYINLI